MRPRLFPALRRGDIVRLQMVAGQAATKATVKTVRNRKDGTTVITFEEILE